MQLLVQPQEWIHYHSACAPATPIGPHTICTTGLPLFLLTYPLKPTHSTRGVTLKAPSRRTSTTQQGSSATLMAASRPRSVVRCWARQHRPSATETCSALQYNTLYLYACTIHCWCTRHAPPSATIMLGRAISAQNGHDSNAILPRGMAVVPKHAV